MSNMPKSELYTEKRKKSNNFNRFLIEMFFLPNISTSVYKPAPPLPLYTGRPIIFVLCPYVTPGRINRILRYRNNISQKIHI